MSLISGVSFPFRFDGRGRVAASTDEQHIRESVQQILLTEKGSNLFNLNFGSNIPRRVFDSVNSGALIRDDAIDALREWEKRVMNIQVSLVKSGQPRIGEVPYRVDYQVKGLDELQQLIMTQAV